MMETSCEGNHTYGWKTGMAVMSGDAHAARPGIR